MNSFFSYICLKWNWYFEKCICRYCRMWYLKSWSLFFFFLTIFSYRNAQHWSKVAILNTSKWHHNPSLAETKFCKLLQSNDCTRYHRILQITCNALSKNNITKIWYDKACADDMLLFLAESPVAPSYFRTGASPIIRLKGKSNSNNQVSERKLKRSCRKTTTINIKQHWKDGEGPANIH